MERHIVHLIDIPRLVKILTFRDPITLFQSNELMQAPGNVFPSDVSKTHEFWLQKEQSGKKFNYGKDKIEQVASQLITTGFGRDAAEE